MDHGYLLLWRRQTDLALQRSISGLFHRDLEPMEAFDNYSQAYQGPVEAKGLLADENDQKVDVPCRFGHIHLSFISSCAIHTLFRDNSDQQQETLSLAIFTAA